MVVTMPQKSKRRVFAAALLLVAVVLFLLPGATAFQYMGSVVNTDFFTFCLGPAPWVIAGCLVVAAVICMILPDREVRK